MYILGSKKIILLFSQMQVTRKNPPGRPQIYFFNRFSGDILFSSLVSFAFLILVFVVVYLLFFELKNIYSDTYSTMRAGE